MATGTLFLVGTPIGNLGDMTDRARQTLASVDVVAAEDTRRTGRLLAAFGIEARLMSFFEGNETRRVPELLRLLQEGRSVAVVSDAGMPGLSDPGYRLVAACVEAGVPVDVVPGPSAAVAALVVSGLPTDRFVFEGFLPRSGRARAARLSQVATESRTVVLFESPRRVEATLADLLSTGGDRPVAIVRELTKLHQEVLRGSLSEVSGQLHGRELKGEVAIVVGASAASSAAVTEQHAVRMAQDLVQGGARKRDAARLVARLTGMSPNEIYVALTTDDG